MKLFGRLILVCVILTILGGSALAAPGASEAITIGGKTYLPISYLGSYLGQQSTSEQSWWAPRLGYSIVFDRTDPANLALVVTNTSYWNADLRFSTSQTHDIVIKQDGHEIWRESSGKNYLQVTRTERLRPGDSRLYESQICALLPGEYEVLAYFMGAGSTTEPVATSRIVIPPANRAQLSYRVHYDPAAPENIALLVKNETGRQLNVLLPSSATHDILLEANGRTVWRASTGIAYTPAFRVESFAPGETKRYTSQIYGVSAGTYQAKAYFAGAPDSSRPVATATVVVPAQTPVGDSRFTYRIVFDHQNPWKIALAVTNRTNRVVEISLPSGMTHDFVLKSGGVTVWRASSGMAYTMALRTERFQPGETKAYESEIPFLASGQYEVLAYYLGAADPQKAVLTANIFIPYAQNPLKYEFSFRQTSFSGNQPRLLLSVRNESGDDVSLSKAHVYRFIVRDKNGNVVFDREVAGLGEVMKNGATTSHFVNLDKLAAGSYSAEVRLRQGTQDVGRIGGISFSIR